MDARANGAAGGVKGLAAFASILPGLRAQRAMGLARPRDAERVDERLFNRG